MKKPYFLVALGLNGMKPNGLLTLGRNMVAKMTGNPAFTTPVPLLADVTDACDKLEKAIDNYVLVGGRRALWERNEAFATLRGLVLDLGGYVQATSNGDRSIIESAGCEVRKQNAPIGELPAPQNVRAKVTAFPGRIDVLWGGVRGRNQYRASMCEGDPKDEKNWNLLAYTSKNRYSVMDLESGKMYYFRIEAIGAAGIGPVSDVANAKAA